MIKKFNFYNLKNSSNNKDEIKKWMNLTKKKQTFVKNNKYKITNKSKTISKQKIKSIKKYSYKIDNGNNNQFISELLEIRNEFTNMNNSKFLVNLEWKQGSTKFIFGKNNNNFYKKSFNYYEFHSVLTNKINLYKNIVKYCKNNYIDHSTFIPITYYFDMSNINFLQNIQSFARIYKFNQLSIKNEFYLDKSIINNWNNFKLKNLNKNSLSKIKFNLDNFFNNIKEKRNEFLKKVFINKTKLEVKTLNIKHKELSRLKLLNYKFNFINLPSIKIEDDEEFINNFDKVPEYSRCFNMGKNLWIFKLSNYNRGIGIEVFNNLEDLNKLWIKYSQNDKNNLNLLKKSFIIQKYIEKPLLINKKKFDIRIWVLLDQNFDLYIFKEGYVRLSCINYNLNTNEKYVHLTNDAVQKNHESYGLFNDYNKLSFEEFEKYVKKNYKKEFDFEIEIFEKIKTIVKLCFHMVKCVINKNNRENNFQIFGFDFMIDNDYNVWLIEINSNPCLSFSGKLLTLWIKRMLNDCFKLTIDKIFKTTFKLKRNYPLLNYDDNENLFKYLLSLNKENINIY